MLFISKYSLVSVRLTFHGPFNFCMLTRKDVGFVGRTDACCVIGMNEVEAVLHFLVLWKEFDLEGQKLLKRIGDIEGSDMWLEKFKEKDNVEMLCRMVVDLDRMSD